MTPQQTIEAARALARRVSTGPWSADFAGAPTFGAWLDALPLTVEFFHGGPLDFSFGEGSTIHLRTNDLDRPEWSWVYAPNGLGLANVAGWVIHEARHTDPAGRHRHTAGPSAGAITMDSTMAQRGAWWAEWAFFDQLSQQAWLPPWQRAWAASDAAAMRKNIVDGSSAPNAYAIGKIPHLSAAYCAWDGGTFPYCGA